MRNTSVRIAAMIVTGAAAGVAHAQSATVAVTHDHPTGLVQPGQTIRINVVLTWTGVFALHHIAGDSLATPDLGAASAPASPNGPSAIVNPGAPVLGSIRAVDIQSPPPGFLGGPSPYFASPLFFLRYDWTAPTQPGEIEFDWIARPNLPNPLFYEQFISVTPIAVPTTYLGTSVTVIPAPATGLTILALATYASVPRRRRSGSYACRPTAYGLG